MKGISGKIKTWNSSEAWTSGEDREGGFWRWSQEGEASQGLKMVITRGNTPSNDMGSANMTGKIVEVMLANIKIIRLMVQASVVGLMNESTTENGSTIRCMELVCTLGLMVVFIWVNLKMAKRVVMDSLDILMANSMKVIGQRERAMDQGLYIKMTQLYVMEYGRMANKLNGLQMKKNDKFRVKLKNSQNIL